MAFVLGLVGGAIRNAMRGDRDHQPGHNQHYSSPSSSQDYNSRYYQPSYAGPDNRYQRDFCDPYHTYAGPAPVSRRQYKRECKRSRRAERHARRAEAFGMPMTSRAAGPGVYPAGYPDTRPGWRSYPGMAGDRSRDVGHATMPDQSHNYGQDYGQGGSRTTDGRGYAAEARPPPVYATRERRTSLDEGVPDETDAPPAYERFSTPGGSGGKAS